MNDQEPTVFVVDDDPGVADSIRLLLRSVGLPAEVFLSASGFLEAYEVERAGCLVLDVRMPGMSGLDLQARLKEGGSTLPIIFVTAHGDVPMAVEAVKNGALDFVQKPFRDQDLLDKIHEALEVDARGRARRRDLLEIRSRLESLTPRETEVMELVVSGKPNKNIARELEISQRTVEIHRARVMEKMQV
ncbi:MAG: response regulator transcription factor, partial [Gemmatimonadetes bacterium]|nr:response regulator transcription factor [Gemmatimonadota bacterium]